MVPHLEEFPVNNYIRILFYSQCQFDLNADGGFIQPIIIYGKRIMLLEDNY